MSEINSRKRRRLDASYLPLIFGAIVTIVVVYFIYLQTQSILRERLRERILSMVAIASLQLSGEEIKVVIDNEPQLAVEIEEVQQGMTESLNLKELEEKIASNPFLNNSPILNVTRQMKNIRAAAPNIRYIYIWRKTDINDNTLAFVTDSDTVYPVDWDGNGKIDDIEYPPMPGEDYDISDYPLVKDKAFDHPVVQQDFIVDRWGTFLSGFAPIRDRQGNTVAIIGMDVEIGDFYKIVRGTLIPFSLLGLILLALLTIQTLALIRIWKSRVTLLREIDKQKDELLSIVSHQLATPVSSIKWYTEMLKDGDLGKVTKQQKDHLSSMMGVAGNLSDLVSMILDVSRIQLGRMQIEKQLLDLNAFFKEILEIINPKATQKKVNFKVNLPSKLPEAMLDRRYTHMTIENLLSNAVKYTPEGGSVNFNVQIKGNTLYCEVKDTGVGIPKADQEKIFGKMFRATNVRNEIDGNGFGLYVAKGAVESQGGKIWFKSEEGKGTTFFVELPLKD